MSHDEHLEKIVKIILGWCWKSCPPASSWCLESAIYSQAMTWERPHPSESFPWKISFRSAINFENKQILGKAKTFAIKRRRITRQAAKCIFLAQRQVFFFWRWRRGRESKTSTVSLAFTKQIHGRVRNCDKELSEEEQAPRNIYILLIYRRSKRIEQLLSSWKL